MSVIEAQIAARLAAVSLLMKIADEGGSFSTLLAEDGAQVPEQQRSLYRALSNGLARWHWQLKPLVDGFLRKPFKRRDQDLHWLLQLGILQIEHLSMPDALAVNTTVECCSALDKDWAKALVNGVLRRYLREREQRLDALDEAARWAQPDWYWRLLERDWPKQRHAIARATNLEAPMVLRVNRRAGTREQYLQRLSGAVAVDQVPDAIELEQPCAVQALPGFEQGLCSVQDGSAQQPINRLDALGVLKPGLRLLDACAAPGGKFCHLLEVQDFARALALDVSPARASRIESNLQRLQLESLGSVRVGDAVEIESWWDGEPYDLIVLDVPCSGSGVIRRHPDIKLTRRQRDIPELAQQQYRLLQASWRMLKTGAHLLYMSCSVLRDENEGVIGEALSRLDGAQEVELFEVNSESGTLQRCTHGWQRLPGGAHDGFYQCLLRKVA